MAAYKFHIYVFDIIKLELSMHEQNMSRNSRSAPFPGSIVLVKVPETPTTYY